MNNSPWRLEEVDGGDEQYPVESHFAVHHTPPDEQNPRVDLALQHKFVSSVLRYATPLPMNMTPVPTVGGLFPPFCSTPDPSRSTGPRSERRRSVSSILRYARPHFHRLFRPSSPDEHDDAFHSDPAGWLPMNTTTILFLSSDPTMYTSPGRTYA